MIQGVVHRPLIKHRDGRGELVEIYRESWPGQHRAAQFNVVASSGNVMRGMHLHLDHADHLLALAGRAVIGMFDCRSASPTFGRSDVAVLGDLDVALTIPVGVAHAFWLPKPATMMYAVDQEWQPDTDLQCRWDDPDLGLDWASFGDPHPSSSTTGPLLSGTDASAGTLSALIAAFNER